MNFVLVNEMSVVHQGSNGVALASAPDVCNTPSPGGPIPLPYPNVAKSSDLADGTTDVTVEGNSIGVKDCSFATSTGDEAGTGGNDASGVTKGKAKFLNYSFDVKLEGNNACRLADPMSMNGNGPGTATTAEAQPSEIVQKLGPDGDDLCQAFCWCDARKDPEKIINIKPPRREEPLPREA